MSNQICAITFDVGGTLIKPWPSVGHIYGDVAARYGFEHVDPAQLDERFQRAWDANPNFDYTRSHWRDLVGQTFDGLVSSVDTFFDELYERFAEPEAWHVFEDVRPALEKAVSSGRQCAVVSNWDERLRGLLHRLELDGYFEALIISCEIGVPKPDRRIFEAAAEQLGLPPSTILHVGDSLTRDVRGAAEAGFQTVRICRETTHREAGAIHSLLELPGGDRK